MIKKLYAVLLFMAMLSSSAFAADITITDGDLVGGQTYDWTNDNTYFLDGLVFLEAGGVLNIQEGTVIKGVASPTTGDNTSALIITRGATINATGSATAPIIFTAEADDTSNPSDLGKTDRGRWGGVIVLGNGVIARPDGEDGIEGIDANEPRARYGGNDNTDNSGTLTYVSIRHAGAALAPGDEINGLTLGGVGSGTTMEFIEVFANLDDGIEWFGGAVSIKYASVAFCGDDSYDYDFGWRGNGQFWFSIHDVGPGDAGRSGEHDGANPDGQAPFSQPTIFNTTYIGSGTNPTPPPGGEFNDFSLLMRDNAGGFYNNSIFTDFPERGLAIEDRNDSDEDAFAQLVAGEIAFNNNIWFGFGDGNAPTDFLFALDQNEAVVAASSTTVQNTLLGTGNEVSDPSLGGISRNTDGGLDPRPNAGSPALSGGVTPSDPFFDAVEYRGAFGNQNNWLLGWTALDEYGFIGDLATPVVGEKITIRDGDLQGGQTYNWTANNCYLLDGLVFLEPGGTLNIEPGTIIQGKAQPTTGDNTSALIITRGATIVADGSADAPIIFTAENPDGCDAPALTKTDRGRWGGVIVLGSGIIARPDGEDGIEGIDANEPRARYGGADNTDNSGTLRYVSIRHAGAALAPGDEINGLTLGGVGSGTTIEYVEVFANLDDGIEWFGGAVDIRYASVAFCGDDSYDYDFGWRGRGQFWFSIHDVGPGDAGRSGEHDGANPDGQAPFSQPTIFNATYLGSGIDPQPAPGGEFNDFAILMRDNAGGFYNNSVFTDYPERGLAIEDRNDTDQDAYAQLLAGELAFNNNIWFDFGDGNAPTDFLFALDQNEAVVAASSTEVINTLVASGNQVASPNLAGISRDPDGGLDPRPNAGPAVTGAPVPADPWFQTVDFYGAFGNADDELWLRGWTALDDYGFLGDLVDVVPGQKITITDNDLVAGGTYNWTANNCYLLDGLVFLEPGGTLNIEPGTVIQGKAQPSTGDNTSALIITRGATIVADGTADDPIIFTAENPDGCEPPALTKTDRGRWGGVIVLGSGIIARPDGEDGIEGIDANEPRARYGGADNTDNSGTLRYVSIRHAGAALAPGDEINGLTLGGVGSGTTIEYVEVFANLDDGIEWFGGAVDIRYASVAFCGDDSYDYDFGWRGRGQFWFSIHDVGPGDAGRSGEHDGANPDGQAPFSQPTIFNATYLGSGIDPQPAPGGEFNDFAILMRDNAGGFYNNSVFTDYPERGLAIEDRNDTDQDAYAQLLAGELAFNNNIWFDFGDGNAPTDFLFALDQNEAVVAASSTEVINTLVASGNQVVTPNLAGISRNPDGGLDPRPNDGAAVSGAPIPADPWFKTVGYYGAFGNADEELWLRGWTALDDYGFLGDLVVEVPGQKITITDNDLVAGGTYNWTANNCYLLDGLVFLEEGGTLNIEPGTVIQGKAQPSTGDNTSALIITRGATINASGSADAPIIFTAENPDGCDPPELTKTDRGRWGGVIVLGSGVIARPDGEDGIEGIDANEPRARYGGNDNGDNSGTLRYVSIRHAGAALAPGDEINGLTLGGVGSGTTIEFVEVFANLDDGIEWFGGAVSIKYASVAFCGDDSYDYDFGWRGKGQFWFSIHDVGPGDAGRSGEHDGANPDGQAPFSQPEIWNTTYLGSGTNPTPPPGGEFNDFAILARDNAGGFYNNSIFTDYPERGLAVEDRNDTDVDAYAQLLAGELAFNNNIWFDFGDGNAPTDFLFAIDQNEAVVAASSTEVINTLVASGNQVASPNLAGISRDPDGGLDPRPNEGPARSGAPAPTDAFFDVVEYYGAFAPTSDGLWLEGWTALSDYGFLGNLVGTEELVKEQNGYVFTAPFPSPTKDMATMLIDIPQPAYINIVVMDINGQLITEVMNKTRMPAGESTVQINTENFASGTYVVLFQTDSVNLAHKLVVVK